MHWKTLLPTLLLASCASAVSCGAGKQCPEDAPCCSQYGECGTGSYCVSGCNIKNSYNLTSCMPVPRMESFSTSFSDTKDLTLQTSYLGNGSETDWLYSGWIDSHDNAIIMEMPKYSGGSVISSSHYLWYGKIEVTLKSSRTPGVITSFILYSDVEDEIDFEFVGNDLVGVQSNYYSQGALNYTNAKVGATSDTFENYHTYSIDWTEDQITWAIDGQSFRVLKKSDTYNETSKEYSFPQTPSRIQMSLWPGGNATAAPGTREWAGGEIDWDADDIKNNGYFYAYLRNVTVEAYDLPANVAIEKRDGGNSSLKAYAYNSTDGWADNIVLTSKKTWLGDDDATGFNPKNEDKKSSSSSSSSSKSSSKSSSSSSSGSSSKSSKGSKTTDSDSKSTSTSGGSGSGSGSGSTSTSSASGDDSFAQFGSSSSSSSSKAAAGSVSAPSNMLTGLAGAFSLGFISLFI